MSNESKKNSLRISSHGKGYSYLTYSPGAEEKAAIEAELKSEVCDKIESTNQYEKIGLLPTSTRNELYSRVSAHFASLPPRYCLDNNIDDVILHLKLLNQHIGNNDVVVSCITQNSMHNHGNNSKDSKDNNNNNELKQPIHEIVLITVVCYDRPKIYNRITFALDKYVHSTLDADIMTTTTGKAFDRILVELVPEYNGRSGELENLIKESLQIAFTTEYSTSGTNPSNSSITSLENHHQSSISLPSTSTSSDSHLKSTNSPPTSFHHSQPISPVRTNNRTNNNNNNNSNNIPTTPSHNSYNVKISDSSISTNLSPSDITIVKEITRNHYSIFYEGIMRSNHEKVMVKKPSLPNDESKHEEWLTLVTTMFTQELNLMLSIGSGPHICRLIGSLINGKSDMMIVYEYIGHVTLHTLLHQHNDTNNNNASLLKLINTPEQLIHIALDIANSIKHLHSLNVIHRDIKPANIMFDSNGKPKLFDYSLACFIDNEEDLKPETGSYRYMAPEIIKHEKYGLSADVYSFGIFLWELYFKTIPHQGLTSIEVAYCVAKSNLRPSLPEGMNSYLRAIMTTCWHPNPESRPNFRDICKRLSSIQI
mmetsp:Transcript_20407/g.21075  ORF Transcript_20407/g.21075 Transcript_20407/m.21075 type:complete len:594 (+) Transcript_20407:55-1836(+)